MDQASQHGQGPPAGRRRLIVNADDLGLSDGINRGIFEAHERGIVTSASLMVLAPAAPAAAQRVRNGSKLGVGLHLDLEEWACRDNGEWYIVYTTVDLDDRDASRREVDKQIAAFFDLMGRAPTHIDSHQHVHQDPRVTDIVREAVQRVGVPLRHFEPRIEYRGDFYGQDRWGKPYHKAITPEALVSVLGSITAPVSELACHPGYAGDVSTMYQVEREMELAALCDPRVKQAITDHGIELIHFGDLEQD